LTEKEDLMSATVYKGFQKEEMELHFNPRAVVPDYSRWAEERNKASLRKLSAAGDGYLSGR
jgi:hypothetical protein